MHLIGGGDTFWFVNIGFLNMIKFYPLVQFPVDKLSHPYEDCIASVF